MIDGKEVSWRHIQGVYDYTIKIKQQKLQDLLSVMFGLLLGARCELILQNKLYQKMLKMH